MTLKIDSDFLADATERAKARAASVAEHPHSKKLSAKNREAMLKYQHDYPSRKFAHA